MIQKADIFTSSARVWQLDRCICLQYTKSVADIYKILSECTGFDWDEHNAGKSRIKHGVLAVECEEIFFNQPLVVADDDRHSIKEKRFYALGRTDTDRRLFVVFVVRGRDIRVISARDMNRKEKKVYEEHA